MIIYKILQLELFPIILLIMSNAKPFIITVYYFLNNEYSLLMRFYFICAELKLKINKIFDQKIYFDYSTKL